MSEKKLAACRIYDFNLVPDRLLHQLQMETPFNIEMARRVGQGAVKLGMSRLYVFHDEDHVIRGFLWMTFSPITESIYVDAVSFDKDLQDGKTPHQLIRPLIQQVRTELEDRPVYTLTRAPRAAKKHGWQPTRVQLMEAGPEILKQEEKEQWEESQA